MKERADSEFARKMHESRVTYSGQLARVSKALKNAKSSQLPQNQPDISRITASLSAISIDDLGSNRRVYVRDV